TPEIVPPAALLRDRPSSGGPALPKPGALLLPISDEACWTLPANHSRVVDNYRSIPSGPGPREVRIPAGRTHTHLLAWCASGGALRPGGSRRVCLGVSCRWRGAGQQRGRCRRGQLAAARGGVIATARPGWAGEFVRGSVRRRMWTTPATQPSYSRWWWRAAAPR